MAKRLSMFVLRSKVKIADESDAWAQYGIWDADLGAAGVAWEGDVVTVRVAERRFLKIGKNLFPKTARQAKKPGRCRKSAPGGR